MRSIAIAFTTLALLACGKSGGTSVDVPGPAATTSASTEPGAPGVPGAAGAAGSMGPRGTPGPAGPAGAQGPAGAAGAQGPAGPAGAAGANGAMGPMGPMGPAGATGATGAAGATGPAGATGATGAVGAQGTAGPQGTPGPQGPPGAPGTGAGGGGTEEPGVFLGFTAARFTGAIPNGRPGAHASCAAEFPEAHLCHVAEYANTNSMVSVPADGAWIDGSVTIDAKYMSAGLITSGRDTNGGCSAWTSANPSQYSVSLGGGGSAYTTPCGNAHALACCGGGASHTRFAGYTSATTSGNGGGRPAMNVRCHAAFPTSHLCHMAELTRANSTVAVPASGAWVDGSVSPTGEYSSAGLAGSGRDTNGGCSAWTSANPSQYSTSVSAGGSVDSTPCATVRPQACCY